MNFFDKVKEKINKKINPKNIKLIDNSYLHTKHKSFDVNKFHLKIIIKSKKLKSMNKIMAHKEIFSILKNLQKDLGLSILIVEQNANLALNLSDYAYVLELGRVAMSDSTGKVMNSRDIQEFYLGMHQDSQIGKKRWKNRKTWR